MERLRCGHRTVGRWTLAQICRHLADTFHGSIDGFDMSRHRWKRALIGKPLFWFTLRFGLPRGVTVDPVLEPPPDIGLEDSIVAARAAINRYSNHAGPLAPHPIFGTLRRSQWDRLHGIHAAYHLGFALYDP